MNNSTDSSLYDARGRSIRYLRVSLTDRCNYSCAYCKPNGDWLPAAKPQVLTLEEIVRFVDWMVEKGVQKIRLTGGEPLLRKGVVSLVSQLRQIRGLKEITMTTNGHLLERFAAPLKDAGLDRLNISLDTLDKTHFKRLTGGCLDKVLAGIDAVLAAGFRQTRVNAVLLSDVTALERRELIEYCWDRDLAIAFIEMMPIGNLSYQIEQPPITREKLMDELSPRYRFRRLERPGKTLAGPVDWYESQSVLYKDKQLGTISPMSDHHFCETCNRARLTATGGFRGCLGNDEEVQLLHMIRTLEKDECLQRVEDALNRKRDGHSMDEVGFVPLSVMTGIGG